MKLTGLHILLTYQCTYECDHCFMWGSPWQTGTLTLEQNEGILAQAKDVGVTSIYFEGGESFLYYAVLVWAVRKAADMGFSVGIVSNSYWANSESRPLQGKPWEYLFYVDFVGSIHDEVPKRALDHLGEDALTLRVLGSYPRFK